MIRIVNEHLYRVGLDQRQRLLDQRAVYQANPQKDPLMQEALLGSVDMLLGDVEGELAEYDALRAGNIGGWIVDDLAGLPDMLIRARIASGLTQQQLAQRLDLPEAALERYENGWYGRAGLDVLVRAAAALGLEMRLTGRAGATNAAPAEKLPAEAAVAV